MPPATFNIGGPANPTDWMKMRLQKNTLGEYILGDPSKAAPPILWGLPVVATNAMAPSTFLVGSFDLAAQIFDRSCAMTEQSLERERHVALTWQDRVNRLAAARPRFKNGLQPSVGNVVVISGDIMTWMDRPCSCKSEWHCRVVQGPV
jgi:Phage capsid family